MKTRPMIVGMLALVAGAAASTFPACAHHVQRAPSLVEQQQVPEKPHQPGFFSKAGQTAWNVVSTPVRWVAPGKKPKKPEEPVEPQEPPEMIIVQPGGSFAPTAPVAPARNGDIAASQPK